MGILEPPVFASLPDRIRLIEIGQSGFPKIVDLDRLKLPPSVKSIR